MSVPAAHVYVDIAGSPELAGRLWSTSTRGREVATFRYEPEWLAGPQRFALEPALALGQGPYHTRSGRALFGAMGDSAPDRWGRNLITRMERRLAAEAGRAVRSLRELDFLLAVSDETRQGALRFAQAEGGPFLAAGSGVPPLLRLPELLAASDAVLNDADTEADLHLLLAPGSSVGGARPKASVRDLDGALSIAKFPAPSDLVPTERWEAVALTLAGKAGIPVPGFRLADVAGRDVLIVRRFDRTGPGHAHRIPFLSAMSALDAADQEMRTYGEIGEFLRRHGAAPRADLPALWRRLVFNILASNTDDHLRNHAFLYHGATGWRLAPAYDLNPVPLDLKPRVLSTAITEDGDPTAALEPALDVAAEFDLDSAEARAVAAEVARAVTGWKETARALGLSAAQRDRMASAFEHPDLPAALG